MQVKKQQLELDVEQQTGSRYGKTVYCHAAYLTYMQSILKKKKLGLGLGLDEAQTGIKIAGRNINNLGYANLTTLMAESILLSLGFSRQELEWGAISFSNA